MLLISKVSELTGVPTSTLRMWCNTGKVSPAEQRETWIGPAWFTTVAAVKTYQKNRRMGRPPKNST